MEYARQQKQYTIFLYISSLNNVHVGPGSVRDDISNAGRFCWGPPTADTREMLFLLSIKKLLIYLETWLAASLWLEREGAARESLSVG